MKKVTREEAKKRLKDKNITQAEWGRQNGYTSNEIGRVLNGLSKCRYGREREIAIKLNIQLDD
ncbi:MAG: DNA-binding protein [Gammaproteobacteria bacterium]|nr:MAG: DNA-binding protein [Gammaproteobacteria bacterium]